MKEKSKFPLIIIVVSVVMCIGVSVFAYKLFMAMPATDKMLQEAIAKIPAPYSFTYGKMEMFDGGGVIHLHDVTLTLEVDGITAVSKAKRVELEQLNLAAFHGPDKGAFADKLRIYGMENEFPGYKDSIEFFAIEHAAADFAAIQTAWVKMLPVAVKLLAYIATRHLPRSEDVYSLAFWLKAADVRDVDAVSAYMEARKSIFFPRYTMKNVTGEVRFANQPLQFACASLEGAGWKGLHHDLVTYEKLMFSVGELLRVDWAKVVAEGLNSPDYAKIAAAYGKGLIGLDSGLDSATRNGSMEKMTFTNAALYLSLAPNATPAVTISNMVLADKSTGMAEEFFYTVIDNMTVERDKIPPFITVLLKLPMRMLPAQIHISGKTSCKEVEHASGVYDVTYSDALWTIKDLAELAFSGNMVLYADDPDNTKTTVRSVEMSFVDKGIVGIMASGMQASNGEPGKMIREQWLSDLRAYKEAVRPSGFPSVIQLIENMERIVQAPGTFRFAARPKTPVTYGEIENLYEKRRDDELGITSSYTAPKQ